MAASGQKALIRHCPVCGHDRGDILHPTRFVLMETVALAEHYDVVACSACGFAFADTPSSQADYNRYYAEHSKYEDAATSTGSALSPRDRERLRLSAAHIAQLLPEKSLRIADIGCANGGLLAALKRLGYPNLTGIDPSPVCAANTAAQGIASAVGFLSQLPEVETRFDVVLLTYVLEHVRDLSAALRSIEGILAPEGYVYFAVPDAARYCEFTDAPFQEFNIEHINHFTVQSLTNFMHAQGYRAVQVEPQAYDSMLGHESLGLLGLFQRLPAGAAQQPLVHDLASRPKLQRYIDQSQAVMDQFNAQLEAIFSAHPQLILWGTGQLALKLLALPSIRPDQILALVDGNPIHQGSHLLGKPILLPDAITAMDAPILLMTTLHQQPISETIRQRLGMKNPILTLHAPV